MKGMARQIKKIDSKGLEKILDTSLRIVGVKDLDPDSVSLLLRLILSGIGHHFFEFPDTEIQVGFLTLKKNPMKTELFAAKIEPNARAGVTNARTLWEYYNGDLLSKKELKGLFESFMNELLEYSQEQESKIGELTNQLESKGLE